MAWLCETSLTWFPLRSAACTIPQVLLWYLSPFPITYTLSWERLASACDVRNLGPPPWPADPEPAASWPGRSVCVEASLVIFTAFLRFLRLHMEMVPHTTVINANRCTMSMYNRKFHALPSCSDWALAPVNTTQQTCHHQAPSTQRHDAE